MLGYKYNTEHEAINARKLAANFKGLPLDSSEITLYWVNYEFSENDNFYFIIYVLDLEKVLGNPIEINISTINI